MISIYKAEGRHLEKVLQIEKECFSPAWSYESFRSELNVSGGYFTVAEENGEIVGYCVFRSFASEGELLKIAVAESRRGHGVGTLMFCAMLDFANQKKVSHLFLEVRESNDVARQMYARYGFTQYGRRVGYYSDPAEDAILMRRDI